MVTVTENCNQPPLKNMEDQKESAEGHTTISESSKTLHNFRSMADLIRSKEVPHPVEPSLDDISPTKEQSRSDENENSVQDLRMNGHLNHMDDMREDHLRRWYRGDLGMRNPESYNVDVDGESSHSGIPSDMSSDGEDREQNGMDDEDMDEEDDTKIHPLQDDIKHDNNDNKEGILSHVNIVKSDVDNISEGGDTDVRKSKRKQSTPKPREVLHSPEENPSKVRRVEHFSFQAQLNLMQQQLKFMQERLLCQVSDNIDKSNGFKFRPEMLDHSNFFSAHNRLLHGDPLHKNAPFGLLGVRTDLSKTFEGKESGNKPVQQSSPIYGDTPKDLSNLAKFLKDELTQQVGTLVDTVVTKIAAGAAVTNTCTAPSAMPPATTQQTNSGKQQPEKSPVIQSNDKLPIPHNEHLKDKHSPCIPISSMNHTLNSSGSTVHSSPEKPPVLNLSPRMHQLHQPDHFGPRHSFMDTMKFPSFPFAPMTRPKLEQDKLMENKLEIPRPHKPKINDKLINPFFEQARNFADFNRNPWFPPLPFPPYAPAHLHSAFPIGALPKDQEQTEALPLVVSSPKKKRTKVTDTRLSPRAARALLQEPVPAEQPLQSASMERKEQSMPPMSSSFHSPLGLPVSLPTSVAIPNPSLQHSDVFSMFHHHHHHQQQQQQQLAQQKEAGFMGPRDMHMGGSPPLREDSSPGLSYSPSSSPSMFRDCMDSKYSEDSNTDGFAMTTTLTPMHLRKAKLMFFFVRYPSSSILKIFFPDVKFNKNNTAQLVKWFSNFREFYYIQMEKYARQALAEGIKNPEEILVTVDSELYRVLNLHYNRNNQLEIPESFRVVVQATLREFFKAIQANKDAEQSWKKPIYKIIARMDDTVPDFFKSPNWMEQLNDI